MPVELLLGVDHHEQHRRRDSGSVDWRRGDRGIVGAHERLTECCGRRAARSGSRPPAAAVATARSPVGTSGSSGSDRAAPASQAGVLPRQRLRPAPHCRLKWYVPSSGVERPKSKRARALRQSRSQHRPVEQHVRRLGRCTRAATTPTAPRAVAPADGDATRRPARRRGARRTRASRPESAEHRLEEAARRPACRGRACCARTRCRSRRAAPRRRRSVVQPALLGLADLVADLAVERGPERVGVAGSGSRIATLCRLTGSVRTAASDVPQLDVPPAARPRRASPPRRPAPRAASSSSATTPP